MLIINCYYRETALTYFSLTDLMEFILENSTCDWPRSKTHSEEPAFNSSDLMNCDIRIFRLLR